MMMIEQTTPGHAHCTSVLEQRPHPMLNAGRCAAGPFALGGVFVLEQRYSGREPGVVRSISIKLFSFRSFCLPTFYQSRFCFCSTICINYITYLYKIILYRYIIISWINCNS